MLNDQLMQLNKDLAALMELEKLQFRSRRLLQLQWASATRSGSSNGRRILRRTSRCLLGRLPRMRGIPHSSDKVQGRIAELVVLPGSA